MTAPVAVETMEKGTVAMSYELVINAVKSNPALAAAIASSTSWEETEKILKAHGIEVPTDAKPTSEEMEKFAAITGGGGYVAYPM